MNGILNECDNVEEYEVIKPEFDEVEYLFDKVNKDCKKNFSSFIYRCAYDFKYTSKTINDKYILNIFHDCLESESIIDLKKSKMQKIINLNSMKY